MLVGLYILWIFFKSITDPESCPPLEMTAAQRAGLGGRVLSALLPPLLLIVAVLGSILTGIATPTESASVGAVGALLLAAVKRRLSMDVLQQIMRSTMAITSMVFIILLGADSLQSDLQRPWWRKPGLWNSRRHARWSRRCYPGRHVVDIFSWIFLDTFQIIFIVVPIAAPVLIQLGVNPVWLGVMIGMNLQTSFLTPPFGFALFYLRGAADASIRTSDIYRGAIPFVALQAAGLFILWFFPSIATKLPEILYSANPVAISAPANIGQGSSRPAAVGAGDDFSDLFRAAER